MLHSLWLPRGCINSKHCLPLCATDLEVGNNSVEKMLFSETILSHSTLPHLGHFLWILVVRFLMRRHLSRGFKSVSNKKGKLHPQRETTHLLFSQLLSWTLCCDHSGQIFCLLAVEIQQTNLSSRSHTGTKAQCPLNKQQNLLKWKNSLLHSLVFLWLDHINSFFFFGAQLWKHI